MGPSLGLDQIVALVTVVLFLAWVVGVVGIGAAWLTHKIWLKLFGKG